MDSDEATAKKRQKKSSKKEQSLERIIEQLRKIHNNKWEFGEYLLWATALVNKQLFIINSNSKVDYLRWLLPHMISSKQQKREFKICARVLKITIF